MKESINIEEKVTVLADRYIRSHGKVPRGYGKWGFSYDDGESYFFTPSAMSFADATKWINDKAKEDKKNYVYVMEGINDFSPISYAKKVANKVMSLADAAAEANMSMVALLKLVKRFDKNFKMYTESGEIDEALKMIMNPIMHQVMKAFSFKRDPDIKAELRAAIQAAIEPILRQHDIIVEGEDTLSELGEMTLGQLERIEDYAVMITERMNGGQPLESWMFSQITIALENLNSVHDAMDGVDGVKEGFSMDSHIDEMRSNLNNL